MDELQSVSGLFNFTTLNKVYLYKLFDYIQIQNHGKNICPYDAAWDLNQCYLLHATEFVLNQIGQHKYQQTIK